MWLFFLSFPVHFGPPLVLFEHLPELSLSFRTLVIPLFASYFFPLYLFAHSLSYLLLLTSLDFPLSVSFAVFCVLYRLFGNSPQQFLWRVAKIKPNRKCVGSIGQISAVWALWLGQTSQSLFFASTSAALPTWMGQLMLPGFNGCNP